MQCRALVVWVKFDINFATTEGKKRRKKIKYLKKKEEVTNQYLVKDESSGFQFKSVGEEAQTSAQKKAPNSFVLVFCY
jgi:hypothetical protein